MQSEAGAPASARRYEEFRDGSESWTFDVREYRDDLDSVVPSTIPAEPGPREAYRAAVFLEGFIQEQRAMANWSDETLDEFESFESTLEVEALAKALREFASRGERGSGE